jgi:MYXO-CTERM domain-containing protein
VAGLLFSAVPTATASDVHDALLATTRPAPFAVPDAMGHDDHHGYGIVDPAAALRAITGMTEPDAGVAGEDAGAPADAGTAPPPEGGCGCRASRAPGSFVGALLVVAALLASRRR